MWVTWRGKRGSRVPREQGQSGCSGKRFGRDRKAENVRRPQRKRCRLRACSPEGSLRVPTACEGAHGTVHNAGGKERGKKERRVEGKGERKGKRKAKNRRQASSTAPVGRGGSLAPEKCSRLPLLIVFCPPLPFPPLPVLTHPLQVRFLGFISPLHCPPGENGIRM